MAKRSALELLEHYYQVLIFSLPMKDRDFMDDLTKHDLLTGSFKANLEALSMNKERASYFLDNIIKAELAVGNKTCFVILLTVMNNSKHDNVKDLAKQIESEYDIDANCNMQPKESELHRFIVPKFAAKWRDLGVQLEIPKHNLDTIAADHPSQSEKCCKAMLQKWMEITSDPTWDKLQTSIFHLPGLSHNESSKASPQPDSLHDHDMLLAQKPQMFELSEYVIPKVVHKWEHLAFCMRYKPGEVEAFRKDSQNTNQCCIKLFKHWLESGHGPEPKTYQTLLNCIKRIDDLKAASEEIERDLIKALAVVTQAPVTYYLQPLPRSYQSSAPAVPQPQPAGVHQPKPAGVPPQQPAGSPQPQPAGVLQPQPIRVHQPMLVDNRNRAAVTDDAGLSNYNGDIYFHPGDDVKSAFIKLAAKVTKLLQTYADFDIVRRSCLSGADLVAETSNAIMSSSSFSELFDLLAKTKYWSWVDIRLLDAMVAASEIQAAVKLIKNYKEVIYGKKLEDVLPDILNEQLKKNYYTKVVTKIKKNHDEITVAVLLKYRLELEEVIMDINKGTLVLEKVEMGCIEVYWYIPNCYVYAAYKNASKNCHKFHVLNLLQLKIGNNKALMASGIKTDMSAEEVLNKVEKWLSILMEDHNFIEILNNCDILPEGSRDNIQAQRTKADKAQYYIQHIIKNSAATYLPKLFQAMEQYCTTYRQDLFLDMIAEIKRDEKPTMRDIDNHVVVKSASKWKQLGSQLNIGEYVIRNMEYDHTNNCERCCREMLSKWLEETAHSTWGVLTTALDKISDTSLKQYAAGLKEGYKRLPEISKQQWFDCKVKKQFINITLVREKDINNEDDHYSPEHKIKDEVVYGEREYWHYNDIFDVDYSKNKLFLIEGDTGTGKTTLAYKVCKKWADGDVLQQYSCIVLVCLKDIKSQGNISLEALLAAPGQSVNSEICNIIQGKQGEGVLIWLEGWDELVQKNAFDNLLKGMMLPSANVVITTRPSATINLERFNTCKFKVIGFTDIQIEKYVICYCADDHEAFMILLKSVPGLVHLARVPLYLAILVKLFKTDKSKQLPRRLIDMCSDFLMICLQNQKGKLHKNTPPIQTMDELPTDMQEKFHTMQKCAYDRFFHHSSKPFTEEEISKYFFYGAKVPLDFDGLGIFSVKPIQSITGTLNTYDFTYKLIQELLAALYLSKLKESFAIRELPKTFGKKEFEMVWVFYAGLTYLKRVPIQEVIKQKMTLPQQASIKLPVKSHDELLKTWNQCKTYYEKMATECKTFLLTLISCCYETNNSEACRVIADNLYADKVCRLDIPPIYTTPYLLLAVSYFITHSGKAWSLRSNNPFSVEHLFKFIADPYKNLDYHSGAINNLWVLCCVVTSSDIDTYCNAIKSQPLLQWIHLLPGSYLGDDGTSKLCECFSFDNQVIRIEIDGCGIESNGLRSIGDMLKLNKKILYIDVRKNKFKQDDVKEFLQQIKDQQYLEILLLDKEFCENSEIIAIKEEINVKNNNFYITNEPKY